MEVHVGSIDEEEDEQGIAHMIEHVAFLGSKKREKLLGTGARSNAYTDFHHTVFHIHSPISTKVFPFMLLTPKLTSRCGIHSHSGCDICQTECLNLLNWNENESINIYCQKTQNFSMSLDKIEIYNSKSHVNFDRKEEIVLKTIKMIGESHRWSQIGENQVRSQEVEAEVCWRILV